jgi:hypothetical protein
VRKITAKATACSATGHERGLIKLAAAYVKLDSPATLDPSGAEIQNLLLAGIRHKFQRKRYAQTLLHTTSSRLPPWENCQEHIVTQPR